MLVNNNWALGFCIFLRLAKSRSRNSVNAVNVVVLGFIKVLLNWVLVISHHLKQTLVLIVFFGDYLGSGVLGPLGRTVERVADAVDNVLHIIIMVKVKAICRNEKEHVKQTNNEMQRVQRNPTDTTMHPFQGAREY